MNIRKKLFGLVGIIISLLGVMLIQKEAVAFSVSPMKQAITLVPGSTYTGRVSAFVVSEANGGEKMYYEASIAPLVVKDENNEYYGVFDQMGDRNDIVNWTTISNGDETSELGGKISGSIDPGEMVDFSYKITVPENAKGGGQYFAVRIQSVPNPETEAENGNVGIVDYISIASVVYTEIAGDINNSGLISDGNIPGFLLSSPITASFVAKNDGNTHALITYYLQVFPLFSDEEVYTTEEAPLKEYVLPGTSRYMQQSWTKSPSIGIFKVRQTVYYGSVEETPSITEKMVIICPVWLLFLIVFGITAIIIYFVSRAKARRAERRAAE